MLGVYDRIVEAGYAFGLRHAGYRSMDSLRMEKGYRAWGLDLTDQDTPLEAGLGFAVAFDKGVDFIGRDALLRQRDAGLERRLVMFVLDDPEPYILGNEPVYRDGEVVGRITSGFYGHTVGRSVGMGYVRVRARSRTHRIRLIRAGDVDRAVPGNRKPPPALRPQESAGSGLVPSFPRSRESIPCALDQLTGD